MAKRRSKGGAYFGLPWIVSLILAIIPITSWVLGFITRFSRGKLLWGLVQLIGGLVSCGIIVVIFWVIDLIAMITRRDLVFLA